MLAVGIACLTQRNNGERYQTSAYRHLNVSIMLFILISLEWLPGHSNLKWKYFYFKYWVLNLVCVSIASFGLEHIYDKLLKRRGVCFDNSSIFP